MCIRDRDNARAAFDKLIARIAALDPQDGSVDEAVLAEYKEKFLQQMGNDLNLSLIHISLVSTGPKRNEITVRQK